MLCHQSQNGTFKNWILNFWLILNKYFLVTINIEYKWHFSWPFLSVGFMTGLCSGRVPIFYNVFFNPSYSDTWSNVCLLITHSTNIYEVYPLPLDARHYAVLRSLMKKSTKIPTLLYVYIYYSLKILVKLELLIPTRERVRKR